MSLMSPRALATIRRTTRRWMVDRIELWSHGERVVDPTTNVASYTAGDKFYEGPARFTATSGPREMALSEGVMMLREADCLVPIDTTAPKIDDFVKVIESEDPEIEGSWFRVTDVRVHSQQAARRFSVVQAQPSREWGSS